MVCTCEDYSIDSALALSRSLSHRWIFLGHLQDQKTGSDCVIDGVLCWMSMDSPRTSTGLVDCGINGVLRWMSMDSPRTSIGPVAEL